MHLRQSASFASDQLDAAVFNVSAITPTCRCGRSTRDNRLYLSCRSAEEFSPLIPLELMHSTYTSLLGATQALRHRKLGIMIVTDSDNAFSSVHTGNPRRRDRLTRLHLRYVRDGLDLYNLSFISDGFNLSDVGANRSGMVALVDEMNLANVGYLGFLARAEMKVLAHQEKITAVAGGNQVSREDPTR